jgi:NFU1 iron-sulfur cluster scaffold homolog, mitochondrial
MSDPTTRRRIRAQSSASDEDAMGFVLDAPLQSGSPLRFDAPDGPPLARALFAIPGVRRIEVTGAMIWAKKTETADWDKLKPAIAAVIRHVLDETETPLLWEDAPDDADPDSVLFREVEDLLDRQVNPAVAAHGGQISADRVESGTVYLRMSGGCQGCAASSATLREGVERMLRAALPQIREIVDVTDHAAGSNPFYARDDGPSPVLNRPVPEGVIDWDDGHIIVDPAYLAPKLGLTADALRLGLQLGDVTGVTERGEGADAGKTRVIMRTTTRAWAAEVLSDGTAREIPPPREAGAAVNRERELADRVRAYLVARAPSQAPVTYGALARALGLWAPGSVRKITRALETTMREDAAADRPFIAARAVSRGQGSLPGKGFFELARSLLRGPHDGESDQDFYYNECARLNQALVDAGDQISSAESQVR